MSWVSFLVDQCRSSVDDVTILHLVLTLVYLSSGHTPGCKADFHRDDVFHGEGLPRL
jgi:hypothetical protein